MSLMCGLALWVQVRPSTGLKALLALLRPFASRKAGRKFVAVESLTGIEAATGHARAPVLLSQQMRLQRSIGQRPPTDTEVRCKSSAGLPSPP